MKPPWSKTDITANFTTARSIIDLIDCNPASRVNAVRALKQRVGTITKSLTESEISLKRRTLIFVLVPLALLLLILLIGPTTLLLSVKPDLVVIELERQGCYGICPIYSLHIVGDGQVSYEGQRFVQTEGVQSTRIGPGQVQDLVNTFENIHFSALPNQLSYGIDDLEESRTCITVVNRRKCVEIRSTYPAVGLTELAKVKELNTLIDEVTHIEQWVGTRQQIIEQKRQSK